jgi:SAM-dependent methyltransferase
MTQASTPMGDLRGAQDISDAVLVRLDGRGPSPLVAYVASTAAATPSQAPTTELWAKLFDRVYGATAADPTANYTGWMSSYSGTAIPEAEMDEWVEGIVGRICDLGGRRFAEVGCGSGLVMWRLVDQATEYVGTDISEVAVRRLNDELARRGHDHATIHHGSGLAPISRERRFDAVVIAGVTQYLPSADALATILDQALELLAEGGHIFVGDVRNLDLMDAYHLSCVLAVDGAGAATVAARQALRRRLALDPELAIAPDWFLRYAGERGLRVAIAPKHGRADNELHLFRYDVALTPAAEYPAAAGGQVAVLPADCPPDAIDRALGQGAVRVRAVPRRQTSRLAEEAFALLFGAPRAASAAIAASERAAESSGRHPCDFEALAARHRVRLLTTPAATGDGAFDVLLGRDVTNWRDGDGAIARTELSRGPADRGQPVRRRLCDMARRRPGEPRPAALVRLGSCDVTAEQGWPRPQGWESVFPFEPATDEREEELIALWSSASGQSMVGRHDSLASLGAERAASAVAAELRERALELPPSWPLLHATPADLASLGTDPATTAG